MKNIYQVILMAISVLLMAECKKEEQIAGKGGSATLNVTPQHHGLNIDSLTVYIKYNTNDKPQTYDDSAVCKSINGKPVATFNGLKAGKYYLYGNGWDQRLKLNVHGGLPYNISSEAMLSCNLAVSEE